MARVSWEYTTYPNIGLGVLAVLLLLRFFTSGGPGMLRMMAGPPKRKAGGEQA